MEKKSRLMLAQIDNVAGEALGFALEQIMGLGANNVQLISTITKKGRPGKILLIDADAALEDTLATYLARELKVSGYQRIDTSHVFQEITFSEKDIIVAVNGTRESFPCMVKILGDPAVPLSLEIEHDFIADLQRVLKDRYDYLISLVELRSLIEVKLRGPERSVNIEINKV